MKIKLTTILNLILCSTAALPIFFDLSNGSIIFLQEVAHPTNAPKIPLPISFAAIAILVIWKSSPIIKNILKRKYQIVLSLLSIFTAIGFINDLPITRLIQLIIPALFLLALPSIIRSSNYITPYTFILSLASFASLHFIYYFNNKDDLANLYNKYHILYGYEIYHANVGYPEIVILGSSLCFFILGSSNFLKKKSIFAILGIYILMYSFQIGRAATGLSIAITFTIFILVYTIRTLLTLKLNKNSLIIITWASFLVYISSGIINTFFHVIRGKIQDGQQSPRLEIWNQFYNIFSNDLSKLLLGGAAKDVVGHNYIISIIALVGVLGLTLLVYSYWRIIRDLYKNYNLQRYQMNNIQVFSILLALNAVIIGNIVNDSLTQVFNIVAIIVYTISIYTVLNTKEIRHGHSNRKLLNRKI